MACGPIHLDDAGHFRRALSDGASDTIYLREHIACRYSRATGHPKVAGSRIRDLEFRNWMADGAWGRSDWI